MCFRVGGGFATRCTWGGGIEHMVQDIISDKIVYTPAAYNQVTQSTRKVFEVKGEIKTQNGFPFTCML